MLLVTIAGIKFAEGSGIWVNFESLFAQFGFLFCFVSVCFFLNRRSRKSCRKALLLCMSSAVPHVPAPGSRGESCMVFCSNSPHVQALGRHLLQAALSLFSRLGLQDSKGNLVCLRSQRRAQCDSRAAHYSCLRDDAE